MQNGVRLGEKVFNMHEPGKTAVLDRNSKMVHLDSKTCHWRSAAPPRNFKRLPFCRYAAPHWRMAAPTPHKSCRLRLPVIRHHYICRKPHILNKQVI